MPSLEEKLQQMHKTIKAIGHAATSYDFRAMRAEIEKLDAMMVPVVITTDMVRELRQRTGEGMMSCHKALKHSDGDMDKAVDYLRSSGTLCI